MSDLTHEVDLIILGGGASTRAAEDLASYGVNVMLCDPQHALRSELQGELVRKLGQRDHVACVAHLYSGGGVRIETNE